ncbi:MAG: addiction module protein [Parafilimonas sp.]
MQSITLFALSLYLILEKRFMLTIEEILKLPEDKQVAIMEAIQDNLDDFENNDELSADHIAFIKERIKSVENSNQSQYSWQEIKKLLNERWNTQ